MRFPRSSSRQHQSALELLAALCERPNVRCRHVLGYADEIQRRVNVNGELSAVVARSLGFERMPVKRLSLLLASGKFSPERLACTAMRDPCLDDEDISEIFGRSVKWARVVREQMAEIMADEPMDPKLEWFDPDFQKDDPLPDEIARRAKEVRLRNRLLGWNDSYRSGIRSFQWNGKHGSFVSVGVA